VDTVILARKSEEIPLPYRRTGAERKGNSLLGYVVKDVNEEIHIIHQL
jgi:hypothetical protein